MSAIHYLAELRGSKKRILDDAPEQIISGPWKRLVYDRNGRILRAGYSLCLLERLQDSLRRSDIGGVMARTTSVTIGVQLDSFISRLIDSGRYGSTSEVMRSALRLPEQQETNDEVIR